MTHLVLPFGEWLPDLPSLGLQGCTVATNLLPSYQSYTPFPRFSATAAMTLGGVCRGSQFFFHPVGTGYQYAGDLSALYAVTSAATSLATRLVGGAYSLQLNDTWEFAQWNTTVYAVGGRDTTPQQVSMGAANFIDLSVGVKARHICALKDFLVVGDISDSALQVTRVRWSAINNPTNWVPDAATLADYQDLPAEGGKVQKIVGTEVGIIFQERAIWRMQFVGSPVIFQFDRVANNIGAKFHRSVIGYQNLVFFLSEEGFYAFDGSTLDPIGRGKVDEFFKENANQTIAVLDIYMCCGIDPSKKIVMWAYPSVLGSSTCDQILCYHWPSKHWSLIDFGSTANGINNLTMGYSTAFNETPVLGAFNFNRAYGRFNKSAMASIIQTGEFQLVPEQRAMITEVRPDVIGLSSGFALSILNRNNLTESLSTGAASVSVNATGFCQFRLSSRYFNIRLTTVEGSEFEHIMGVEVDGVPAGRR